MPDKPTVDEYVSLLRSLNAPQSYVISDVLESLHPHTPEIEAKWVLDAEQIHLKSSPVNQLSPWASRFFGLVMLEDIAQLDIIRGDEQTRTMLNNTMAQLQAYLSGKQPSLEGYFLAGMVPQTNAFATQQLACIHKGIFHAANADDLSDRRNAVQILSAVYADIKTEHIDGLEVMDAYRAKEKEFISRVWNKFLCRMAFNNASSEAFELGDYNARQLQ